MTQEEFNKKVELSNKSYEDFVEGSKYILPQKHKEYRRFVSLCYKDIFEGKEVKYINEYLKDLKQHKDFEVIKNKLDREFDDNVSYSRAIKAILKFAENGPEFYEFAHPDMSKESKAYVNQIKKENLRYKCEIIDDQRMMEELDRYEC